LIEDKMISLERNALVTITPKYNHAEGTAGLFRWNMNVSLPFPFPVAKCVDQDVDIDGCRYRFGIHNHFDRVFFSSKNGKGWFKTQLIHKTASPPLPDDCVCHRETLQAVATFSEHQTYLSGNEAFGDAASKISQCMEYLGRFLSKCQQRAPYLAGWLIYPVSAFEVGTIYHDVTHQLPGQNWHACASSVAMSVARNLQVPLFVMEKLDEEVDGVVEGTNELLAEAMVSLMRGTTRLTVLNSYGAVENLAQTILVKARAANLRVEGVPDAVAIRLAEDALARKKLDANELYHSVMRAETGRSLHDEKKPEYDALLGLQKIRHDVAHRGYRPTADQARGGHRTACEVARWLCEVGGYPVKAMTPTVECTNPHLQVFSKDVFAKSELEFAAIRALLGALAPENETPHAPTRTEPTRCTWPPNIRPGLWPLTKEWLLLLRDALVFWR
jgi:hypothetical protein